MKRAALVGALLSLLGCSEDGTTEYEGALRRSDGADHVPTGAQGGARIIVDEGYFEVWALGMTPQPEGRYQAWFVRTGEAVSTGLFNCNSDQFCVHAVHDATLDPTSFQSALISLEPLDDDDPAAARPCMSGPLTAIEVE